MNSKQSKTLRMIFDKPTRADIAFNDAASMLKAIGAELKDGAGSRVRFVKDEKILRFHKPHPQPNLKKYAVEAIRDFLINLGVEP